MHFDSLVDKASPKAVKIAVANIPKGTAALSRVYDSVLARLRAQNAYSRDLATRMLSWLVFAVRPLETLELQYALAIEHGSDRFDPDNISDINDLLPVCHGLVTYDQQSKVMRLAHYTTQEYLRRNHETYLPKAQGNIAVDCLTYLTYENLERNVEEHYPLVKYAACHWGNHAKSVQGDVRDLAQRLFRQEQNMKVNYGLIKYEFYESDMIDAFEKTFSAAHLCAYFDLGILFRDIVENGADPDLKDIRGRTPLSWAAQFGSIRVVDFLMEQTSVDSNPRTVIVSEHFDQTGGNTPLAYATSNGHTEVVRALMGRHDIEVNPRRNKDRSTPLIRATELGRVEVARLLLGHHQIQVNARDDDGRTALWCAASRGTDSIVHAILSRDDTDPNVPDNENKTALHKAAYLGYSNIVRMLVGRSDTKPNMKDIYGQSALLCAARSQANSTESVAQLLLSRIDVDPNCQERRGWSPLHWAVSDGKLPFVTSLLNHSGILADIKNQVGQTALSVAAQHDREPFAQLLLSRREVDPNSRDNCGSSPLHEAATSYAGTSVLSLLLAQEDIDKNPRDNDGRTPLMHATSRSYAACYILHVQLLLSHPSVNALARDMHDQSALDYCLCNPNHLSATTDLLLGHEKIQAYLQTLVRADGFVYTSDLSPFIEEQSGLQRFLPAVGSLRPGASGNATATSTIEEGQSDSSIGAWR